MNRDYRIALGGFTLGVVFGMIAQAHIDKRRAALHTCPQPTTEPTGCFMEPPDGLTLDEFPEQIREAATSPLAEYEERWAREREVGDD